MYPLRSIHFLTELVHPPLQHAVDGLQRVHQQVFTDAAVRYSNFQVVPGGAVLSNPVSTPGAVSSLSILKDRIRLQEHHTGISQEDYQLRLERVADLVVQELQVPTYLAQQFLIQSLVNPRRDQVSREFLKNSLLGWQEDQLNVFGNEPDLLGVRLRLPAQGGAGGLFQIRVENYERDQRCLFLENVGLFRTLVMPNQVDQLPQRFAETYRVMEGPVQSFLSRFDSSS